ncbi:hypothetical protein TNIN_172001 [Trichonephila inaurata madagascariensis]|uniref:Uncharacterized protein n=1 Tax=Trichonephila inaurata madagascariensis TaxID=2747483 RepID=A0A8X6X270_9ARAC|nr:hypothetical protein TNIN_172001 [Trichonephila inaurata madagascariensis]
MLLFAQQGLILSLEQVEGGGWCANIEHVGMTRGAKSSNKLPSIAVLSSASLASWDVEDEKGRLWHATHVPMVFLFDCPEPCPPPTLEWGRDTS